MKVRALRGVCVGVEQHLLPGAEADLDPAQVSYLVSIGAVERLPDVPPVSETPAPAPSAKKEK